MQKTWGTAVRTRPPDLYPSAKTVRTRNRGPEPKMHAPYPNQFGNHGGTTIRETLELIQKKAVVPQRNSGKSWKISGNVSRIAKCCKDFRHRKPKPATVNLGSTLPWTLSHFLRRVLFERDHETLLEFFSLMATQSAMPRFWWIELHECATEVRGYREDRTLQFSTVYTPRPRALYYIALIPDSFVLFLVRLQITLTVANEMTISGIAQTLRPQGVKVFVWLPQLVISWDLWRFECVVTSAGDKPLTMASQPCECNRLNITDTIPSAELLTIKRMSSDL